MHKRLFVALVVVCFGLAGMVGISRAQEESDNEASGYQKISEMGYRNVVILVGGIDTKTAFNRKQVNGSRDQEVIRRDACFSIQ